MKKALTLLLVTALLPCVAAADDRYDPEAAMQLSQAAIGRTIGNYEFVDRRGQTVFLRDDHAGKPLVISLIFTSCHHVCPRTTQHLAEAVDVAREALGEQSFDVVTIGFDVANDTPQAMAAFARRQGVDAPGWRFLSATPETIEKISNDLGFRFFPTPRGFDHLNQSSIVDRDGRVYAQVYGVTFEMPWFVEPMKELVLNRPSSSGHLVASIIDKVNLFCTVYDPTTGRYRYDYSLIMQTVLGGLILVAALFWYFREMILARRARNGG